MESHRTIETITLGDLQARLLILVKGRIHNGEHTERGLARLLGVSQPQIHNVLKGVRRLHPDLADRMITKLGLTAVQLFNGPELEAGFALHRKGQTWQQLGAPKEETPRREKERLRRMKKPPATVTPVRESKRA